jgi:hypothetical protein
MLYNNKNSKKDYSSKSVAYLGFVKGGGPPSGPITSLNCHGKIKEKRDIKSQKKSWSGQLGAVAQPLPLNTPLLKIYFKDILNKIFTDSRVNDFFNSRIDKKAEMRSALF